VPRVAWRGPQPRVNQIEVATHNPPKSPPCPICKRPLPADAAQIPHRPFCSQRCRTIDLGSWLSGAYRVSRDIEEEDLDEGVSRHGLGDRDPDRQRHH
jgi:uncharacterized protein